MPAPATDGVPDRFALRASDSDRDTVAGVLGQALSEGRLTSTEHAQRLDATYSARTLGDLAPLTRDLPATADGSSSLAGLEHRVVSAQFSKVTRGGRWVAARHTLLRGRFGALIVDLSQAVLPGREIQLDVRAFCAKLIVRLPANAHVIDDGTALFSKRVVSVREGADGGEDGPVLRIVGSACFSKVVISRNDTGFHWPWRQD